MLIVVIIRLWIRQFRERRRFLNASIENVHRSRRAKKVRAQTFYPCPPPSGSEHDRYSNSSPSSSTESSSSSSSDDDTDFNDDAFSIDSAGYINTLVRDAEEEDGDETALFRLNVQMEHAKLDNYTLHDCVGCSAEGTLHKARYIPIILIPIRESFCIHCHDSDLERICQLIRSLCTLLFDCELYSWFCGYRNNNYSPMGQLIELSKHASS